MKKYVILCLMGALVVACGKVDFDKQPGPMCQGSSLACITQNGEDYFDYQVTTEPPNTKTDILIVDDNSDSMHPEQTQMANKLSTFINSINSLDWRIGIVTTDMSGTGPTQGGNLLQFVGAQSGTYFITKTTPNVNSVFSNTIYRPEIGNQDERGIYAAIQALRLNAQGFIRNDAHLAVVILSDENERSDRSVRPYEAGRDNAQDLIDFVRSPDRPWRDKTLTVHSIIIKPGDIGCKNTQSSQSGNPAYEGFEYASLSQMTGGVIGSVCAPDYGSQLQQIGAVQSGVPTSTHDLPCVPKLEADGYTPKLRITSSSSWQWTSGSRRVKFTPSLPAGSTFRVQVTCATL